LAWRWKSLGILNVFKKKGCDRVRKKGRGVLQVAATNEVLW